MFGRELIDIRRKTTENETHLFYNMRINSSTTLVLLFEIYQISHSMVPNQIIRETPLEDITLTYKLISHKQLDNFYRKHKSFYVTKSQFT